MKLLRNINYMLEEDFMFELTYLTWCPNEEELVEIIVMFDTEDELHEFCNKRNATKKTIHLLEVNEFPGL